MFNTDCKNLTDYISHGWKYCRPLTTEDLEGRILDLKLDPFIK